MPYVYSRPTSTSFTGKGLLGYSFGPLKQKDLDFYYIEVEKGHDTFQISRKISRTYYVLAGSGYFTIDQNRYEVGPGVLIEVPPKVEYCYSGRMTLLAFARPRWFSGNDVPTKWNPDVVGRDTPCALNRKTWVTALAGITILGKSPFNVFLRLNRALWNRVPSSFATSTATRLYGSFLHQLVRAQSVRGQAFSTLFLRNRPELELIRRLVDREKKGGTLRVAVLGCSTGAEAYSVAWRIRSARPDLKVVLHAVDISKQAVEVAKSGVYSLTTPELTATDIIEGLTPNQVDEIFERNGNLLKVKAWIQEGITWGVGDAGEPEMLAALGTQDIVVANNFLCHMDPPDAERSLRNIARLVRPNGYLFVGGIDLDVRTSVASDLGWSPLEELLEEIHEGDPWLRQVWPFDYGGLEPLNKKRRDWKIRYAAAFRMVPGESVSRTRDESELPNHSHNVRAEGLLS
jgi:chemotaxis methyl-accepting protein methylase